MKYNAFISYRHSPLDMEIAKKVHTGLETYRIPKSVQKRLGIKKIKRVFRDQEELPIGSNLSDNIGEALKESEHLIVICSPRTPQSEWVQKEIETFIKLHGRENVLAVLIEGEPDESFPELLLNDENGNPVEPLAADVRGETAKERNKKFKTEILRLVAPVIGCNYDDLRQRHRERIVKRTVSLVSAAAGIIAVAGIAFGLYHANVADKMTTLANEKAQLADEKTQLADEILQEYRLKQENQSRFLAEEAMTLFKNGEREDAALVAIAALPSEDNDRPYVSDAEYALSNILHVYDTGREMSFDRTITHELSLTDQKLSTDAKHLITRDNGYNVYAWDTETWELRTKIAPEVDKRNYLIKVNDQFADETGIYIQTDHYFLKYDFDGKQLFSYASEDYYIRQAVIIPSRNSGYLFNSNNTIITVNLNTGKETGRVEMPVEGGFYSKFRPSKDGSYLLFEYSKKDSENIEIGAYNIDKNELKLTRLSEAYPIDYCYTPLGNVAVISCNNGFLYNGIDALYLDVVNPQTGRILWSSEIPATINYIATFEVEIKAHSYEVPGDATYSEIVVTVEDEAFTFNELNSKIVTTV
ncbi:MAG: TIR domain-containing protein, partial [Lachnospiraceae bacterium]|nr:TIR domain-containing protein [Lachnospiraceae bacterium]